MIVGFTVILLFQLVGEIIARASGLPIPAPVIGMVLLFGLYLVRDRLLFLPFEVRGEALDRSCEGLLQNMALLFVPAGVGVVRELDMLRHYGLGLVVIVVVTTAISIAVTAWTFDAVARRMPAIDDTDPEAGA